MSAAQTQAARDLLEATEDLMAWCVKNIDVFHFGEYDRARATAERLRKALPPVETWMAGPPPKIGAYRVKCDGPSPNAGYRYWNGERWGNMCQTFKGCQSWKDKGRRSQLKRPVLWLQKGGAA